MEHWIVDRRTVPLATWLAAMPQAHLVTRDAVPGITRAGIVWFCLRAGERPGEILPAGGPSTGQAYVVLADEPDEQIVLQALSAGAAGCCNSHAAPEVLRQVALVVANGGLWVGQNLLRRVVDDSARLAARRSAVLRQDDWSGQLSERETEVARLVAQARSNKEIARQLSISERTVKAHLTSIFEKLELRDRLQLSLRINGLARD